MTAPSVTRRQLSAIRDGVRAGKSYKEIAREMGIDYETLRYYVQKYHWQHSAEARKAIRSRASLNSRQSVPEGPRYKAESLCAAEIMAKRDAIRGSAALLAALQRAGFAPRPGQ